MEKSKIEFEIALDEERIPETITWNATEQTKGSETTKSISLSLWDHNEKNTLRIDLWTKDMAVDEMKRFYIDSLGGMAQSILNATGDEFMSQKINELCELFVEHVKKETE